MKKKAQRTTTGGILWTRQMLDYLTASYATTANADIAKRLGVGTRTAIRKARELNLAKSPTFREDIDLGRRISKGQRRSTNKNWRRTQFKKGEHHHLENEFKPGHQLTPEQSAKKTATAKRTWHQHHTRKSIEQAAATHRDTIYRDRIRMKCGLQRITKHKLRPYLV